MIRSAVIKLTIAYLAVIMALSLGFSLALYRISDAELNHGLRRPAGNAVFRETSLYDFDDFREARLGELRDNLKANLVILNIVTFGFGLGVSYLLARRTLTPIEEAFEAQKRFTADASHELRTPLTAMQTEIEVTLRDKNLTKQDAVAMLESNLEEVQKLRQLADGLLRLAQNKQETLTDTTADVKDSVAAAIQHVQKQAKVKKITIIDKTKELMVRGDETALMEVVAILLDNAIKYSDEKTTITVRSRRDARHIVIDVTDQGHGIANEDLVHIFDRFYRTDSSRTKDQNGGYGLGLSIAKKIIELHGGSITVTSTVGKGTTFSIHLLASK